MERLWVMFFGDSICVGQYVALHKGWVTRMSSELSALGEARRRQVIVTNSSANGRTTRQALEAMPYEVQSHAPNVILVQFGMNDCNYWKTDGGLPRVSAEAFAANLGEIVQRATRFGARWVFLHTNHPTTLDHEPLVDGGPTFEASNRRYNAIIREVATALGPGIVLCDLEAAFLDKTAGDRERLASLLLQDGLHLNEAGHQLYFEQIYPMLRDKVERLMANDDAGCRPLR